VCVLVFYVCLEKPKHFIMNDIQAKSINNWVAAQGDSIVVTGSTMNSYARGVDFHWRWDSPDIQYGVMFDRNGNMI